MKSRSIVTYYNMNMMPCFGIFWWVAEGVLQAWLHFMAKDASYVQRARSV